ncbi:Shedu anti-phage system protein SduA domain-containing protein [Streptomyces sp. PvR034]|uniref:Shedu anti-phage system protein SduA domain-containing protein n=1 Tax=Streptomyces sp. PvR034 TaxID=3156401 RepID=UPI0033974E37
MDIRADFALDLQLDAVRKEAVDEGVRAAVDAVTGHMNAGRGRGRRGGRALLDLLGEARARAAGAGEWQVVRLLQDSVDYAEGRILKPEFEERYRLFQGGAERSDILRDYVGTTLWVGGQVMASKGKEFLAERPDATAPELLEHLRSLGEDGRFVEAPADRPGRYRIPRGRAEMALWIERLLRRERIEVADPEAEARRIAASPEALALLASDRDGRLALRAAELQRRGRQLAALRVVAEDRGAREADLQRALEGQHWIFGGRYVGEAVQRRLVVGDEVDIPLIRGDGSLHVVELKRSMSLAGPLVKRHRGAWVPAAEVHDAVGQAVNYLVGLDENRERLRADFGIETRRASALVLIGHPAAQPEVPEREVNEALRTFNAHVTRVEVLTYKELIDNAERSLGAAAGSRSR